MDRQDSFLNQDIKVTVDAIVFGYNQENGISVLLIKRKIMPFINEWALPGGFVLNHETLEQAVERELQSLPGRVDEAALRPEPEIKLEKL